MPALAPPPPLARPRVAPQLELPTVAFFGRTLAEYARFFALDLAALRGRDVLDVAAGPSSFTAEASARRIDAVAVDPLYDLTPAELGARIETDYAHMTAQIRAKRSLFRFGPPASGARDAYRAGVRAGRHAYFESLAAAEAERQLAAQRFLADYEVHKPHGRYVAGALPRLPFFDGTFDLVLCAHLLFAYAQRFDFEWHVAACRELVRVSVGEVRLHPLCGADGKPYPKLAALRRELKAAGITSAVRAVDYEFFAGSSSMLVLTKGAS